MKSLININGVTEGTFEAYEQLIMAILNSGQEQATIQHALSILPNLGLGVTNISNCTLTGTSE